MTGATDADIAAAIERYRTALAAAGQAPSPMFDTTWLIRRAAPFIVPPGKIITDAAALPSPAVLAALTDVLDDLESCYHPGGVMGDELEAQVATVRAYLAAIKGDDDATR